MVHAAGDTGWVAWTNGVDASVAANVTAIAGRTTPADVDTKIATQHTADNATYAPASTTTTANAAIPATQKGAASGVATLDAGSLIPAAQLGGAWIAPTLLNSWANVGGIYQVAGYRKTADGDVSLRGNIKSGTSVIFNLPAGYRPTATEAFSVPSYTGAAQVFISTSGDVTVGNYVAGGSNANAFLTGTRFSTLA